MSARTSGSSSTTSTSGACSFRSAAGLRAGGGGRARHRQAHREGGARPDPAVHSDAPAVLLDDSAADREPEAGAADRPHVAPVELLELAEEPAHVLRRDAAPVVAHPDLQVRARPAGPHRDRSCSAART